MTLTVFLRRQVSGTSLTDQTPWEGGTFGDALLAPTVIYVQRLLSLLSVVDVKVEMLISISMYSTVGVAAASIAVPQSMPCQAHLKWSGCVQGVVHITGGGFPENIPRVVPKEKDLGFSINRSSWDIPPLFQWLQSVRFKIIFASGSCCCMASAPQCCQQNLSRLQCLGIVYKKACQCFHCILALATSYLNDSVCCRRAMLQNQKCSAPSTWGWACSLS